VTASVLDFADVSKQYGGLRPLRVGALRVEAGERIAVVGVDRPGAEVFVNLATGATLPDTGEVTLFGRPTSAITDSADWLATVDRCGIVSERAVLLDRLTVVQNLALPFTLAVEPPPAEEQARAEALAREVDLAEAAWTVPLAELDASAAMRVRLGRALAFDPSVLLLEHASASLARGDVRSFGATIRMLAERRGLALVALSADDAFARALGATILVHEASSGRLRPAARRWLR
jgi:putative ABC transport system ATP-binding protein